MKVAPLLGRSLNQVLQPAPGTLECVLRRAAHAPWYLRALGGQDPARLAHFPVLTKEHLRAAAHELLTGAVPAALRHKVATSGSSGVPVSFWLDRAISLSEWRIMAWQWRQVGYTRRDWRLVLRGRSLGSGDRDLQISKARREVRLSTFHLSAATVDRYLAVISHHSPLFLHAYPSSATRLATLCLDRGLPLPRFRAVLLGSEQVTEGQSSWLAQAFQAPTYAWYGQSEKVLLGGECTKSRDYHLYPGYGLAEIVDDAGEAITEPGGVGRLLGTGFLNSCAPLIRYDTGDLASWASGQCACGWAGQRINRVVGRSQDAILTPAGQEITIAAINMHGDQYDGIRQIQYVQTGTGTVVVRVVPDGSWTDQKKGSLIVRLRARLPGCQITLEECSELPASESGKVPVVVRDPANYA